ncbi:MAG: hypothetical protein JST39_01380, partial [Bacteroidetes bacterium]|nr:hypothetical protein [Bacteroidota bacterium]
MEFEEMQRIWDAQSNQTLYAINETALYNRIQSKKATVRHIANASEWLLMIVNIGAAGSILALTLYGKRLNIFLYVLAAWMLYTAGYTLISRLRRLKQTTRFDRSMQGELAHAVSVASYQVRLSAIMRWNTLPLVLLVLLSLWDAHKPFWIFFPVIAFFGIAFFASGWEHGIYKRKK